MNPHPNLGTYPTQRPLKWSDTWMSTRTCTETTMSQVTLTCTKGESMLTHPTNEQVTKWIPHTYPPTWLVSPIRTSKVPVSRCSKELLKWGMMRPYPPYTAMPKHLKSTIKVSCLICVNVIGLFWCALSGQTFLSVNIDSFFDCASPYITPLFVCCTFDTDNTI